MKDAATELADIRARARARVIRIDAEFAKAGVPQRKPAPTAPRERRLAWAMRAPGKSVSQTRKSIIADLEADVQALFKSVDAIEQEAVTLAQVAEFIEAKGHRGLPAGLPPEVEAAARCLHAAQLKGLPQGELADSIRRQLADLNAEITRTRGLITQMRDASHCAIERKSSVLYEKAADAAETARQREALIDCALKCAGEFQKRSEFYANQHWGGHKPRSKGAQMLKALMAGEVRPADLLGVSQ